MLTLTAEHSPGYSDHVSQCYQTNWTCITVQVTNLST